MDVIVQLPGTRELCIHCGEYGIWKYCIRCNATFFETPMEYCPGGEDANTHAEHATRLFTPPPWKANPFDGDPMAWYDC